MAYRIVLEKENFKFSGSHFTIFGPAHAERLHGHNYYVSVELRVGQVDPAIGLAFDFNLVKPLIKELTAALDEHVLLPERAAGLVLQKSALSVRATFGAKNYEFPASDVCCLPLANISSEELSRFLAEKLRDRLRSDDVAKARFSCVTGLSVGIEETRGQSVFFDLELSDV